ncbi:MAG: class II aldolase/adducin family protein [Anaerolineales bacterium]|nr:class II aldolase/adducin family protein [Anaerolineales bacterium]
MMQRQDEYKLRQTIVQVCRLMYDKGFIAASDGNVSARLDANRLLITPSGLHKGLLEPEQILIVDMEGQVQGMRTAVSRHLKPTSELPMHLEAYRLRPDIQAVVHAHPPITIALSIAGIPMADCLLPEVIVFLGIVPTTEYATPSTVENVQAIRDFIGNHDGLVLKRHGSLTVGNSVMHAFMRLETLEQQARIRFMLEQIDGHHPLDAAEVQKLLQMRRQMGLSHLGETAEFCRVCGVPHRGEHHKPTLKRRQQQNTPQAQVDSDDIHAMIAEVVHKTLGNSS